MIFVFLYYLIYVNTYLVLNKLYSIYFLPIPIENEYIHGNIHFYYSIVHMSSFILFIYFVYSIKNIVNYKLVNKNSVGLSFIYIQYIMNVLCSTNMTLFQYELNRNIMWLFATPLMIRIYCDINDMKLIDTKIQYHIIPVAINIFVHPYKHCMIYYWFMSGSVVSFYFFMKNLYTKRELLFTTIYLFIWGMFMFLTIIESLQMIDPYTMNIYYTYADMIGKITTNIIINDYTEKEYLKSLNMDLQTIQFISYLLKHIKHYETDNIIKTPYNIEFIESIKYQFIKRIPEDKTALEQELLKKILPLNLHKEYLSNTAANSNSATILNTKTNTKSKSFNMICILFTDIVNYTELANKYNDTIIFTLLSSIYTLFDTIIKQFPHLQKIETIGDAYMVVGDIFKTSSNHLSVIKEIIEFALTIVRQVKTIQTPDNIPLCIRIGIHMGNVSVGILGNEIPRLCVVGNAVNVASRLQSTAEVDTIQFSKHIHEHFEEITFKDSFEIVKKENVFLKNLGSITTYNIPP